MTDEQKRFKAGQTVHVRMKVLLDGPASTGWVNVGPFSHRDYAQWVDGADIVSVEPEPPEPLKVGDEVYRFDSSKDRGTFHLVAIDGDEAWCRFPAGDHTTFSLSDLVRA